MTYLLSDPEREKLERLGEVLAAWKEQLEQELAAATAATPEAVDADYIERFLDTTRRLAGQVNKELPPALDPEAVAEIRGHLIDALSASYEADGDRPLDIVDRFFVSAEAMRHIVRDALDGQPGCDEADAQALLARLSDWLPRISRKDLGALINLGERQIQRILKDGGEPSRRLQLVARLIALLRHAWTPEGVVAWFYRERSELDGKPPLAVLDDPAYEHALMLAVRRGRAQHGA